MHYLYKNNNNNILTLICFVRLFVVVYKHTFGRNRHHTCCTPYTFYHINDSGNFQNFSKEKCFKTAETLIEPLN